MTSIQAQLHTSYRSWLLRMTIETLSIGNRTKSQANTEIDEEIRSILETAAIPKAKPLGDSSAEFVSGLYACSLFLALASFALPETDRGFWFFCSAIVFVCASVVVDRNKKKRNRLP